MPTKKKFRFLLDAAFAHPSIFVKLCKKANVRHIVHDLGLSKQTEDEQIYNLAVKENRFVVTIDQGFRKFVRKDKPGVIIVPPYLSNEKLDEVLKKFVSNKNPKDYYSKAIKIDK